MAEHHQPAGMVGVTQQEFFDLMKRDGRDIMPQHGNPEFTRWEVVRDRALWGWSTPGWRNPSGKRTYAVMASARRAP